MLVHPILQALLEKEAQKRSQPPYGAFTLSRETGVKLLRSGQYKKAEEYLSKAEGLEKDDIRTILKRSKAKQELANFDEAIKDAETVLNIDPGNIRALYQKADATCRKNDFEKGLVLLHRGRKQRKYPQDFVIGKMEVEETIEDCIGRHAGPVLAEFYPVIQKLERQKDSSFEEVKSELFAKQNKNHAIENIMTAKYLEGLSEDMKFFKNLLTHKGIHTPNIEATQKILDIIQDCSNFLEERLETLRTRRPYYVIKLAEETRNEKLDRKEKEKNFAVITKTRSEAKRIIESLRNLRSSRDMKKFIEYAERAIQYINSKSPETEIPNKSEYLSAIYNVIALTYLEQKTFFVPWCQQENCKKNFVKLFLDIPVYGEERLKKSYRSFCCPARNYRKVIDKCNEELKYAKDKHRRLFLLHEVAMANSLKSDYEKAEEAAEKCLSEANKVKNVAWALNAVMLIVKSEIKKKNKIVALCKLAEARKFANKLKRQDVLDFVKKCKADIETLDMESIQEEPKLKEDKVLEIMETEDMVNQRLDLVRRRHLLDEPQRRSVIFSKVNTPRLSKVKNNSLIMFASNTEYSYLAYD